MATNELAVFRGDEPIDARLWKSTPQLDEDGNRVDHVAQRGRFNQKNPGELGLAKAKRQSPKEIAAVASWGK